LYDIIVNVKVSNCFRLLTEYHSFL